MCFDIISHPSSLFKEEGYNRRDLTTYLQMPLFHVQKYPGFLKILLKQYKSQFKDPIIIKNLQEANHKMEALATKVLDSKQISIDEMETWGVQFSLLWDSEDIPKEQFDLLTDKASSKRGFVKKGVFTNLTSNGKLKVSKLYLFTDLILVARVTFTKKQLLKLFVPIDLCLVFGEEHSNSFQVIRSDRQTKSTFLCATPSEKEEWMRDICSCIVSLQSRRS